MDKFISEHFYRKNIEVYCGGNGKDIYQGTVIACADSVLTLQGGDKLTFINVNKIISFWEKK
ncbi:MAG: MM0924 family protein [Promethearchaeota archaeon]